MPSTLWVSSYRRLHAAELYSCHPYWLLMTLGVVSSQQMLYSQSFQMIISTDSPSLEKETTWYLDFDLMEPGNIVQHIKFPLMKQWQFQNSLFQTLTFDCFNHASTSCQWFEELLWTKPWLTKVCLLLEPLKPVMSLVLWPCLLLNHPVWMVVLEGAIQYLLWQPPAVLLHTSISNHKAWTHVQSAKDMWYNAVVDHH